MENIALGDFMRTREEIVKRLEQVEKARKVFSEVESPVPFITNEGFMAALKWVLGMDEKEIVKEIAGIPLPERKDDFYIE